MEDLGISNRYCSKRNICNSSTNIQVYTKRNLVVVSGSKRNSAGVKSNAEVCARGFARGAGEKRARGTFRSHSQAHTRSTNDYAIRVEASCSRTWIPRVARLQGASDDNATGKEPASVLKGERRVVGGNLGSTTGKQK
ncbi:unnamed protein product [Sphagnum balticum]